MNLAGKPVIIDLVALLILLRLVYMAASKGFLREICKISGLLIASFFAFHFYSHLPGVIVDRLTFLSSRHLYFISFSSLFLLVLAVFSLLNSIIGLFLPKEEAKVKARAVLAAMGALRTAALLSVLFFSFHLVSFQPKYLERSFSFILFRQVAPAIYLFSARAIRHFDLHFPINKEVQDYLKRSKAEELDSGMN